MKRDNLIQPPKLMLRFFRWFCHPDFQEDLEGDLIEIFQRHSVQQGRLKAKFLFTKNVFKLFRPGIVKPFTESKNFNNFGMIRNYMVTAFRNMRREKLFTFMNIAGLALGMGCALVIYLIITQETSYDKYHQHYGNIYRVVNEYNDPVHGTVHFAGQIHPLGEALRNDFAGVDAVMTFYAGEGQISVEDKNGQLEKYQETEGVVFAEADLFKIFDFKFIAGDPTTAIAKQGSVVLTQSLAQKYFKVSAEKVNQTIGRSISLENKAILLVTGVIEDIPETTDLPFKLIANYKDQTASNPYFGKGTDWNEYNGSTNCYVLLADGILPTTIEKQLHDFQIKYKGKESGEKLKLQLQPLSTLHTSAQLQNYNNRQVTTSMMLTVGTIGFFLIITAAINFINLSTAQATRRSKEIGIRKTLGGNRAQLIAQHVGETLLTSAISILVALVIAEFLFKYLENVLGYRLTLFQLFNYSSLIFLVALVGGMGLISGFYPALVMAKMDPIAALKNSNVSAVGFMSVRRILVIGQFAISQVLIIGTIVVHMQLNYFLGKDAGFNKESILIMKLPIDADSLKLASLKNNLVKRSDVVKASYETRSPMANFAVDNPINYPTLGVNENSANLKTADEDYLSLYELKLIAGRNYRAEKNQENAVVNRKLTKTLGFSDPSKALGEKFKYGRGGLEFKIVGVVEDFHARSLDSPLENVVLANLPFNIKEIAVKLNLKNSDFTQTQETLHGIEREWNNAFPDRVFDFRFYDQEIQSMYKTQEVISKISTLFAIIAVFIGSLGLYALISWLANQKTKEIGVRKVLGASLWDIQLIFSREMMLMILIAFTFAAPIGYYIMQSWLKEFAFKISMSPLIFLCAIGTSIFIALITIGYKAITASLVNPVNSLRSE